MLAWSIALSTWVALAGAQETVGEGEIYAQQHYERGVTLYREERFEDALGSFRASYELVPSPNSYLYIARSLRGLGRLDEAADAYDRVIRTAQLSRDARYEETAQAASAELAAIERAIGRVILRVETIPEGAVVALGRRTIPREAIGLALPVLPGPVTATLSVPGRAPVEASAEVAAGAEIELRLSVGSSARTAPAPRPPVLPAVRIAPPTSTGPNYALIGLSIASGAVAVLGWAGFAAFGLFADSTFADLERDCAGRVCDPSRASDIDAGRTYEVLANASLVTGIAATALVALFTLWLIADGGEEPRASALDLRTSF
jgi:tetratricopeptide (TPR) repeat protein